MDERLYEERRNANLPFGYWLVVDDEEPPHLIDEQGQRWKSLRDYIWRGRLGMATNNPVQCENQIEFLHTSLNGQTAVVVVNETGSSTLGDQENSWENARNIWYLTKEDGEWRIAASLHNLK